MRALSCWSFGLAPLLVTAWHLLSCCWQCWLAAELCLGSWRDCALAARRVLGGLPPSVEADAPGGESFSAGLARLPQAERRARVLPLAAVHVNKCGGTFGNALLRLPGACPELAEGELLCSAENPRCEARAFLERQGLRGTLDLARLCSGISRGWFTHDGLGREYAVLRGRLVTVLREPGQQLLSGFFDGLHGWPHPRLPRSPREYAEAVQGFAVKMLTRDGRGHPETNVVHDSRRPSVAETRLAVRRLHEGFAFVGLTEEFPLTICLFHAMFGGACDHSEVRVFHAGPRYSGQPYDTGALGGFRDAHGEAVYEAARRIFADNLRVYNVSWETCGACFRQARLA